MLVRSENRRISNIRVNRKSFRKLERIVKKLTPQEIEAAEKEYFETRKTTNENVSFLLREISAYGFGQHMSNEQRLYMRRQIMALCLKHGMPSIWFTINPNDLTNEINIKLTAYRAKDGKEAEDLMNKFRCHIGRIQHLVRDPVSSALFFHREVSLFFEKYVKTGESSIFGKVSCYYACVETNERGALHLHGLLWLDANVHLPNLLSDATKPENQEYAEAVCQYVDSVFSEVSPTTKLRLNGGDNIKNL